MSYAQGSWTRVGAAGFSSGQVGVTVLAISPVTNYPYVAFQDLSASSKATVMAWGGSAWGLVGSAGFTDGAVSAPLCLSVSATTGRPYISFADTTSVNGDGNVVGEGNSANTGYIGGGSHSPIIIGEGNDTKVSDTSQHSGGDIIDGNQGTVIKDNDMSGGHGGGATTPSGPFTGR